MSTASKTFTVTVIGPPSAPTGLASTAQTSSTITLTWNAVSGATSYRVYRAAALVGSPTSATFADSGLAADTSYSYTVSAVNVVGEGSQSSPLVVRTQPGAGAFFTDGFESGDLSRTENGASWVNWFPNTTVKNTRPKTGTYSLEFYYPANTYIQEARCGFGSQKTDLWIKYDFWMPSNYVHTDTEGGNNKFIAVYNDNDSFYMNFSLYKGITAGVAARVNLHYYINGAEGVPVGVQNMFTTSDLGQWHRLVCHFKPDTGIDNGVAQLWKNGTPIINLTNVPSRTAVASRHMTGSYLMGWANSKYAVDTRFYIDDIVYSTSPITP
jgi:hypothetical protein